MDGQHATTLIDGSYDSNYAIQWIRIYCACGAVYEAAPSTIYPSNAGAFLLAWREFQKHTSGALGASDFASQYAVKLLDKIESQPDKFGDQGPMLSAGIRACYEQNAGDQHEE